MSEIKDVAIIMDGNGRWANSRFKPRLWGHIRGASIINSIVEEAENLNLRSLTLYAFSTENWSRPKSEIEGLFKILNKFLSRNKELMVKRGIKFKVIGEYRKLDKSLLGLISDSEKVTANNKKLKLNFAFGYGGKDEIVHAVNEFIKSNPKAEITKSDIDTYLYNKELTEVDLIIRTGGDQRISNYLIWQAAYAELAFTKTKWPDFTRLEFRKIIKSYEKVERRFGGLGENLNLKDSEKRASKNKRELV